MDISGRTCLVTGAASGLGKATATAFAQRGAKVVLVDLPQSKGAEVAASLGGDCRFAAADITDEGQFSAILDGVEDLRAVVHCAGKGATVRVVEKDGSPGSLATYESIVRLNLVGSFNVLRLAAARMARLEPIAEERGVVVLTSSIAAYEGQIGQIPYASSKGGVVSMTLVAARDLAQRRIRVCTIAPGVFDTPILDRLPPDVKASLGAAIPNPSRLGNPAEFAMLALHIVENPMLNGETIRLDGAMRMGAR